MPRKKIPLAKIEASIPFNAFKPRVPRKSERLSGKKRPSRIMYIENKSEGLSGGDARIGRVTFSKTGQMIYYQGKAFKPLRAGYKANYYETKTSEEYWISGPKKDGTDRLFNERVPVEIDDDVREEYWTEIRNDSSKRGKSEAEKCALLRTELKTALAADESEYVPLDAEQIIAEAKKRKKAGSY